MPKNKKTADPGQRAWPSTMQTASPRREYFGHNGHDRKMPMVLETKEEYHMVNGAEPMVPAPVSRTSGIKIPPPPNIMPPKGKRMHVINQCS